MPRLAAFLLITSAQTVRAFPSHRRAKAETEDARAYGRIAWDFLLSNPESMGFYRKSEVTRHYDLLETLGSGSFSIVKRATRLRPSSEVVPDVHVAVKIIDKAKVDNMIDIRVRFLDPVPVHAWLRGR